MPNNPGLTSFRFLAFLAVFLFHSLVFPIGYLGVQAFFVLSGYLITSILVDMKTHQTGKNYFITFYSKRALRIFPAYYFYLLLVSLLALPLIIPSGHSGIPTINRFYHQLIWAASYTYNFFHASVDFKHTHLLSHFWSLAIEEQFYLIWPVLIYLTARPYIKHLLWFFIISGPLLRWLTAELVDHASLSFLGSDSGLIVYVLPFSHFDAFAIGGLFALYATNRSTFSPLNIFILIVSLGLLTSWAQHEKTDWFGLGYSNFMREDYKYVWGYSLFNLFFAALLVKIQEKKFLPLLLEKPALVYLGSISYGLYVFHNAFIWLVSLLLPQIPLLVKIILSLSLTIAISAASYALLEKPALRLKDKLFPRS